MVTIDEESEPRFVVILPITHSPPDSGTTAVEIPEQVRSHLGLDEMKSWVIVSEYNVDRWPTPGITSAGATGKFAYGILPPRLFAMIKEGFVDTVKRGRAKPVRR